MSGSRRPVLPRWLPWIGPLLTLGMFVVAVAAVWLALTPRTHRAVVTPAPPLTVPVATGTLAADLPAAAAPGCTPGTLPWLGPDDAPPIEARACPDGALTVLYARWASAGDAVGHAAVRTSPPTPEEITASSDGPGPGVHRAARAPDGTCVTVLAWQGFVESVQVSAPTCTEADAALARVRLPTEATLRGVAGVFPAASAPGCADEPPAPGFSGLIPLQARRCPVGAATVTYLRWSATPDALAESEARRYPAPAGEPGSWGPSLLETQGRFTRSTGSRPCTETLGYTGAPYTIRVDAPDCLAADAAVRTLRPPARESLPR